MICWLCEVETDKSYIKRVSPLKDLETLPFVVEVCPECHHYFTYGTEDQIKDYILRREIDTRGFKIEK